MNPTSRPVSAIRRYFVPVLLGLASLCSVSSARAELIAYENFNNYTTGSTLDNKIGGYGWSGEWHAISTATINGGSFQYTFPDNTSVTIGGGKALKLSGSNNGAIKRHIPPRVNGQTLYVSFLVQLQGGTAGTDIPTGTNVFSGWQALDNDEVHTNDTIGFVGAGGKAGARIDNTSANLGTTLKYGTTYFVVIKYTGWSNSRYKTARLWLNPAMGSETSSYNNARVAVQTAVETDGGSYGFLGLVVRTVFSGSTYQLVDDVRIGTTWSSVASATPSVTQDPAHPALVVFGDSLSSGGASGLPSTGPWPSPDVNVGSYPRETWIQQLSPSAGYGILHNAYAGGTNYAVGGHTTEEMSGRVTSYLNSRGGSADPAALYVLWCGANDIRVAFENGSILGGANNVGNAARDNMRAEIRRLAAAGAKKFVWANLPDIRKTPLFNGLGSTITSPLLTAVNAFNQGMDEDITEIENEFSNAGVTILKMDAYSWFNHFVSSPDTYGFTNVENANANSNKYLFFDNFHPTAHGHYEFAEKAYDLLQLHGFLAD